MPKAPRKHGKEPRFEEALSGLERIVRKLEEGDLPLDDALKLFEEGVHLSRVCSAKLDEAEKKIEILMKGSEGEWRGEPFDAGIESGGGGGADPEEE